MGLVPQVLALLITFLRLGCCVDPIVTISEPATVAGVKIIQARKGQDLDIVCVVQNKPLDTFVMFLQQSKRGLLKVLTTDTTSEEPQKYSVFNPTSISWRLRIQNVEEGDEGLYLCRVETQPKTYVWDTRTIFVVEPPRIDSLQTSSDKLVEEGKELSLRCNASGRPSPAIIWTRLANADLPSGGKELRRTHLIENSARPEHRGKYLCRAENVAGEEIRIINVQISFRPRVTSDERIVSQAIGYKKELFCEIEAFPEPGPEDVTWTGPRVTPKDPNYEITYSKGANHRITVKLTIHRVGFEDYGSYICAATNTLGNGEYSITLSQSNEPVPDRTGTISGSTNLCHISLLSLLMILSVWLLGGR